MANDAVTSSPSGTPQSLHLQLSHSAADRARDALHAPNAHGFDADGRYASGPGEETAVYRHPIPSKCFLPSGNLT